MPSNVLFAPMAYTRYEASQTLPEKFSRLLEKSGLGDKVNGKSVAIKMHVGSGITYSTIPPVFVRKLVDFVHKHGGDCFITDHYVYRRHPEERGYTESNLGCPVLDDCGHLGKYFYTKEVRFKTFRHVDVAGLIHDADFLIDFSHVKGHGACGFGGACKNIAMAASRTAPGTRSTPWRAASSGTRRSACTAASASTPATTSPIPLTKTASTASATTTAPCASTA